MKEEFSELFKKTLKNYRKFFGYACFFGRMKKDIDVFIIPPKTVKKGCFIKKLVSFLDQFKDKLKKDSTELLVVPHSTFKEEVEYINNKENPVVLHISSFPDIQPVLISKSYLNTLKNPKKVLLGNYRAIEELQETALDYYYNYLFICNCLLSNYPENLKKEKIYNKVNYIYKHVDDGKKDLKRSPKKEYFDCCDFLDKRAY